MSNISERKHRGFLGPISASPIAGFDARPLARPPLRLTVPLLLLSVLVVYYYFFIIVIIFIIISSSSSSSMNISIIITINPPVPSSAFREYSSTGVWAPVFYGNLREETGENGFP